MSATCSCIIKAVDKLIGTMMQCDDIFTPPPEDIVSEFKTHISDYCITIHNVNGSGDVYFEVGREYTVACVYLQNYVREMPPCLSTSKNGSTSMIKRLEFRPSLIGNERIVLDEGSDTVREINVQGLTEEILFQYSTVRVIPFSIEDLEIVTQSNSLVGECSALVFFGEASNSNPDDIVCALAALTVGVEKYKIRRDVWFGRTNNSAVQED